MARLVVTLRLDEHGNDCPFVGLLVVQHTIVQCAVFC